MIISSGLFLKQSNNSLHRLRRKGERLVLEETGNNLPDVNYTHVAHILAPCYVKTYRNLGENLSCLRWSHTVTAYTFSSCRILQ